MNRKFEIIIIDVFNLYYRNYHVQKNNFKEECVELFQNVILAFFTSIKKIMNKYGEQNTLYYFCFDNPHTNENSRKFLYEDYKKNRKEMSDNFYKWIKTLELFLNNFNDNFRLVKIDFLEADDYVIDIINKHKNQSIMVYSADLDWSRSIDDNILWYNGTYEYDIERYVNEFGFDPRNKKVVFYKALTGDVSDNIPNILKGISKKIVKKILEDFERIEDFLSDYEKLDYLSEHYKEIVKDNKKQIMINYQIADYISIESHNESIDNYTTICKRNNNLLYLYSNTFKIDILKVFGEFNQKDTFSQFNFRKNKKLSKGKLF